jgi:hypothetical protein
VVRSVAQRPTGPTRGNLRELLAGGRLPECWIPPQQVVEMRAHTRRFSASRNAVRHTGLDITVHSSDDKRAAGRLSRQGSPLLRWALFEAAKCSARPSSPDYAYYGKVRERAGGNRAALSVARKITRWAHHTLRALGDEAFAPV